MFWQFKGILQGRKQFQMVLNAPLLDTFLRELFFPPSVQSAIANY